MRRKALLLVVAVTVSALAVIELRHRNRVAFAELQALQATRDAIDTEWGQLLLEQGAWAEHRRVEELARARLGMTLPAQPQVVVVYAPERAP
jgi:cell division protein FtsL